jgi:histidine triad (HIT) family protein
MENNPSDCIFCKIVSGKIPSKMVLESDHACCFEDISPDAPHHYLVIPKKHFKNVLDFELKDDTLLNEVFSLIKKVVTLKDLKESGFRIVTNTGDDGGQSVAHVHFHLLGGRQMSWPPG